MKELRTKEELQACIESSNEEPVLLFKHSTRCPISAAAYDRVAQYEKESGNAGPRVCLINVIDSKDLSQATAKQFGIQHQSPQAILVRDGEAVWSASHAAIDGSAIGKALAGANA